MDASFYTDKNSGQDGETLQNLDLEPREITIKAVFQADSNYRLFEKHIKSVFNPKTEGLLKYSDGEAYLHFHIQTEKAVWKRN